MQGVLDETDLTPLLMEIVFEVQVRDDNHDSAGGVTDSDSEIVSRRLLSGCWRPESDTDDDIGEENILVDSTALHLAVYYDL